MRYVFKDLSEIKKKMADSGGATLLLDFDGVLSAIALSGEKAFIAEENIDLLKRCVRRFPVAIITGRTFDNIKKKIDVTGVLYIGSHGLEWEEDGEYHLKPIPKEMIAAINLSKEKIKPLSSRYPGMIFEDKSFMFAVHYRLMKGEFVDAFVKEVMSILEPMVLQHKLRLDHNLKTFELRPEIDWDKGDSVLFAEKHFQKKIGKKFVSIYIGDSLTDEDAFVVLKGSGIAIRVGEDKKSAAKWYLRNQKEVGTFLKWLLSLELI